MEQKKQRAQRRKYHYIYKVTRFDGKYYYGMHSTDNLDDGYKGSGTLLWRSYKKHGIEKHIFEIQEHWFTREDLKLREKELVNEEMLKDPMCMNLRLGGEGGWNSPGFKNAELRRRAVLASHLSPKRDRSSSSKKAVKTRIKNGNPLHHANYGFFGKRHSIVTKEKLKNTLQQIEHQQGEKNSRFGTCWVMKDDKSVSIKKELLEQYLNDGYVRGRKIK